MSVQVTPDFKVFLSLGHLQWRRQEFSFGEGAITQKFWGTKIPSGVEGQSPGTEPGDKVPQKQQLKQFADI